MAALLPQFVSHIKQHQRGQAEGDNPRGEHQVAAEVVGVQHQDDSIRTSAAGHVAEQYIDRYFFIFRLGIETVDAGQIDEGNLVAGAVVNVSGMVLNRNAGKVSNLLAKPGEAIEESRFA